MESQSFISTSAVIFISIQLSCYGLAFIMAAFKFIRNYRHAPQSPMCRLRALILAYVMLETGIQVYLFLCIDDLSNSVFELTWLNIFCIGMDTALMLTLSMYWRRLKYDFSSSIVEQEEDKSGRWTKFSKIKLAALVFCNFVLLGYFIFVMVQNEEQAPYNITIFYGVTQGVAAGFLLLALVSQLRRGIILIQALKNYQKLVSSLSLNKRRFLVVFIAVSIVTFLRCLGIGYLIYYGVKQEYHHSMLLTGLYFYTFSALITIVILLLGFKSAETMGNTEAISDSRTRMVSDPKSNKNSKSSKNRSSSHHETQLSAEF